MATIDKKLIHFNRLADFEARLAAGDIRDYSIVCIKDAKKIWTHGEYYGDLSECLKVTEQVLTDEEKRQVLENLGIEIPTKVSDLENDSSFVSAEDAGEDMATRKIKDATLDGEKVYFASHAKATYMSDGLDVESAIGTKQEAVQKITDVAASAWVEDNTYPDWPYRCDIALAGVTADDYAEIVLEADQASSGDYAPVCETKEGIVSLWSAVTDAIIIPTILITK